MKKLFLFIFLILIFTGCNKKEKEVEPKKVLSYGELVCVYKVQNTTDNTIYTSSYVFNFDDNGILNGATNKETIEFYNSLDSVKNEYKKNLEEILKEYDDIDGVNAKKYIEENKYYFEVIMDNSKMNDDIKKNYLLDQDRISLYNYYTNNKYTCE